MGKIISGFIHTRDLNLDSMKIDEFEQLSFPNLAENLLGHRWRIIFNELEMQRSQLDGF